MRQFFGNHKFFFFVFLFYIKKYIDNYKFILKINIFEWWIIGEREKKFFLREI